MSKMSYDDVVSPSHKKSTFTNTDVKTSINESDGSYQSQLDFNQEV
jgi:hypothetical protein